MTQCPKCRSEHISSTRYSYRFAEKNCCIDCGTLWTSWQQAEVALLLEQVAALQEQLAITKDAHMDDKILVNNLRSELATLQERLAEAEILITRASVGSGNEWLKRDIQAYRAKWGKENS